MAEEETKPKVEISRELLNELFKLAKIPMPEDVTDDALLDVIIKIKSQEKTNNNHDNHANIDFGETDHDFSVNSGSDDKNILVIDDIGVVTYQLKVLLQNLGYNVKVAKDIFTGIHAFIHSRYLYVIMDLFVSTEQEGYILLNETKKIIAQNNLNTKIVIITASNKAENKVKCINSGADYFVKKDVGWQDKIIDIIENRSSSEQ